MTSYVRFSTLDNPRSIRILFTELSVGSKVNSVSTIARGFVAARSTAMEILSHSKLLTMPQFWIAIFFITLAIAQLFQLIKEIDLPFPVYLVLGAVLAITSNAQGMFSFDRAKAIIPVIQDPAPILKSVQPPISIAASPTNSHRSEDGEDRSD